MKHYKDTKKEFLKNRFLTCKCGYNNERKRLENFGTCLRCGEIIDEKSYFKRKVMGDLYGKKKRNKRESTRKSI